MLEALERLPEGRYYLDCAHRVCGIDLAREIREGGQPALARNEVASLASATFGIAAFSALKQAGIQAEACAGYSVGQWTAMCSAGMVAPGDLLRIVMSRAQFMNSVADAQDGMMLAVVGLPADAVADACRKVSTATRQVAISNYNAAGQFTIAGHRSCVEAAKRELESLSPRQLTVVDVSGAWHCGMMTPAAEAFGRYLTGVTLRAPEIPITDNVTGLLMPTHEPALQDALTRHLDHPVRWDACVRTLIALGVERFVEIGFGAMLTKFGFFIDRSRQFLTYDKLLPTS